MLYRTMHDGIPSTKGQCTPKAATGRILRRAINPVPLPIPKNIIWALFGNTWTAKIVSKYIIPPLRRDDKVEVAIVVHNSIKTPFY